MKVSYSEVVVKKLGHRIKEIRAKQNISQAQLAFECGTEQKHISRIELGQVNTGIAHLIAIANALNVHVRDLFDFDY